MTIERNNLPGIGIVHAVTTAARQRVGVISYVGGRRDLVVYDPDDPDRAAVTVALEDHEAQLLAYLLASAVSDDHLDLVLDLDRV
jgi:TrkA domain protein